MAIEGARLMIKSLPFTVHACRFSVYFLKLFANVRHKSDIIREMQIHYVTSPVKCSCSEAKTGRCMSNEEKLTIRKMSFILGLFFVILISKLLIQN